MVALSLSPPAQSGGRGAQETPAAFPRLRFARRFRQQYGNGGLPIPRLDGFVMTRSCRSCFFSPAAQPDNNNSTTAHIFRPPLATLSHRLPAGSAWRLMRGRLALSLLSYLLAPPHATSPYHILLPNRFQHSNLLLPYRRAPLPSSHLSHVGALYLISSIHLFISRISGLARCWHAQKQPPPPCPRVQSHTLPFARAAAALAAATRRSECVVRIKCFFARPAACRPVLLADPLPFCMTCSAFPFSLALACAATLSRPAHLIFCPASSPERAARGRGGPAGSTATPAVYTYTLFESLLIYCVPPGPPSPPKNKKALGLCHPSSLSLYYVTRRLRRRRLRIQRAQTQNCKKRSPTAAGRRRPAAAAVHDAASPAHAPPAHSAGLPPPRAAPAAS